MHTKRYFLAAILIIIASLFSLKINAQLFAPNVIWSSNTQYVASSEQDSIFVFLPSQDIYLAAQFSDSSASSYLWRKYSEDIEDFEIITGAIDSTILLASRGGYRVEVTRLDDDSTEVYTAWVFVDDVTVDYLRVHSNACSGLELRLITTPSFYEVNFQFTYFDLSTQPHTEKNVLGAGGYFANHVFEATNSKVIVNPKIFSLPFIFVEYENELNGSAHGPLYNSEYTFSVTTPFSNQPLSVQTEEVNAISTKADFEIYFNKGDDLLPDWENQSDDFPNQEALLEIKLKSLAENSDSIFWNILNDDLLFLRGGDSILWHYSTLFDYGGENEAFPPKEKMRPGIYKVEHVSLKITNGITCKDTLLKTIEVDTSFINPASIPNVFSPNNDGVNDFFVLKEIETSVISIKSFKISILSRWGKLVYTYTGDPKQWEGWNGKIDGKGGDAAEGVYYYVIEAVGWDGRKFRGDSYTGFLHLFR